MKGAAYILLVIASSCDAQPLASRDYLEAVLPPALVAVSGIEVPAAANIRLGTNQANRFLEFRLIPGQARKNNGIRSEIAVDYPFSPGDVVKYAWKMRLPEDFEADEPRNRWWIMGQWHDQPDRTKGETWANFPAHSPPVSLNYSRTNSQDYLSLLVGSPRMKNMGQIPLKRGKWHALEVVIHWSQGPAGRVAVFVDGSASPAVLAIGRNMHNDFQHYLKLGMYRHPEISTENRLQIGNVQITRLPEWPPVQPATTGR